MVTMVEPSQHHLALPDGSQLAEFRIERVLSVTGFGITYLAVDPQTNEPVAIEEYLPNDIARRQGTVVRPRSTAHDGEFRRGRDQFLATARALTEINHANLAHAHRVFEAHNTAYLVMEYEVGERFDIVLVRHERDLDESELRRIALALLDALEARAVAAPVHASLEPAAIQLRADGSPVLMNLAASRAAAGRQGRHLAIGLAPGYAAIEQYTGRAELGPRTDIYSLSAVLYRVVSGRDPLDAPARVLEDEQVPASRLAVGRYSRKFLRAIDVALAVRPEDRPQSLAEWREMLAAPAVTERPAPAPAAAAAGKAGEGKGSGAELRAERDEDNDWDSAGGFWHDIEWGRYIPYGVGALASAAVIAAVIAAVGTERYREELAAGRHASQQLAQERLAEAERILGGSPPGATGDADDLAVGREEQAAAAAAEERRVREMAVQQREQAERQAAEERRQRELADQRERERQQAEARAVEERRQRELAEQRDRERQQAEARAAEERRQRELAEQRERERQQAEARAAEERRQREVAERRERERQQAEVKAAEERRQRELTQERERQQAEARAAEERRQREVAEQRERERQQAEARAAEERRQRELAEQRDRERQQAEARAAEERRQRELAEQRERERQQAEARAAEERQAREAAEQRVREEAETRFAAARAAEEQRTREAAEARRQELASAGPQPTGTRTQSGRLLGTIGPETAPARGAVGANGPAANDSIGDLIRSELAAPPPPTAAPPSRVAIATGAPRRLEPPPAPTATSSTVAPAPSASRSVPVSLPRAAGEVGRVEDVNIGWGYVVLQVDPATVRVGDRVYARAGIEKLWMTVKRINGTQVSAAPDADLRRFTSDLRVYKE